MSYKLPALPDEIDEAIENEPQHVTYIDELLWLLEEAERVGGLEHVINSMSDGIVDWLEKNKRYPPLIEVWSEGDLLISSGGLL